MPNLLDGFHGSEIGGHFGLIGNVVCNLVRLEGKISPLHDVAEASQLLYELKLVLQSLGEDVSIIDVFDEIDTEQISQAGSNVLALDYVIGTAIGSP